MERGVRPALIFGAAAFAVQLAFFLLRKPADLRIPAPHPGSGGGTTPLASPSIPAPGKSPPAARPQGTDSFDIPLDPEAIAKGVQAKLREHGEILARLKGQVSDQERVDLGRRASDLSSEIGLWTARLADHKAFQFKDLFAGVFRDNPIFKYEAAGYLAALPGDAGHDVLLGGIRGSAVHDPAYGAERGAPEGLPEGSLR